MRYSGKFGMYEMERAAELIVDIIKEKFHNASINDMATDYQRVGYLELIYSGWLRHGTYNGQFYPTELFFERLGEPKPSWMKG